MTNPVKIPHPLRSRTGASQRRRVLDALQPGAAPVDGRTLADILYFIGQYAAQVNFFQVQQDEVVGEYLETSDWQSFFEQSAPFQLARLSKVNAGELETEFLRLQKIVQAEPLPDNVDLLLRFVLAELIEPVTALHQLAEASKNSLATRLALTVKTTLFESFQQFIALHNAASTFLCTAKVSFLPYMAYPWQLGIDKVFECDPCVPTKGNRKKAARLIGKRMADIFYPLLAGFKEIQGYIPTYLEESLVPLEASFQQKHQPHLALLFTFLELFKHFQGDINQMGQRHLDYFYKEVLRIVPKKAVPDKAHLVFEIAKHLEQYKVKKDTLFVDGKDEKNQDIRFGLNEEVVIDKAQVSELRTLHLENVAAGAVANKKTFVEGMYIAPVANSEDGKGKAFTEENGNNWFTLGSKESKLTLAGKTQPEQHPYGRVGFVIASPVLLLQEGSREIKIDLECTINDALALNKEEMACFMKLANPFNPPYYYLTQEIVSEFLARNDEANGIIEIPTDIIAVLSGLLQISDPFPIGYDLNAFFESVTQHECGTKNFDLIQYKSLFEDHAQTSPKCFIKKGDVPALGNNPDPLDTKGLDYLNGLFNQDDDEDNTYRFVDFFQLGQTPGFTEAVKKKVQKALTGGSIFDIALSGKDGWIRPDCLITEYAVSGNKIKFHVTVALPADMPGVVFYDKEKLIENFHLENPLPLVKISLKPDIKISCDFEGNGSSNCCLETKDDAKNEILVSPYHFLRDIKVDDVKIHVRVCGVKNLSVQSDESIQDVNSPIFPFGPRPVVGSSFIVGSNEIFGKNWQDMWLKVVWKDRPASFKDHYEKYDYEPFEDNLMSGANPLPITDDRFKMKVSLLKEFTWIDDGVREIFPTPAAPNPDIDEYAPFCFPYDLPDSPNKNGYGFSKTLFPGNVYKPLSLVNKPNTPFVVTSQEGYLKMTLDNISFQHSRYAFVLAQQMFILAKVGDLIKINFFVQELKDACTLAKNNNTDIDTLGTAFSNLTGAVNSLTGVFAGLVDQDPLTVLQSMLDDISTIDSEISITGGQISSLDSKADDLETKVCGLVDLIKAIMKEVPKIPKEPYTPVIKEIIADYRAKAEKNDLYFVHLYPFENTSKKEDIQKTTLFPTFTDEGSLFIGLKALRQGASLNLLMQLAEATSDSERNRATIFWHYLTGNRWLPLRKGFELIEDRTDGLTVSGIVQISLPDDIADKGNTIMPEDTFWIKASTPENTAAISEVIGIHAQAAIATALLAPSNDLSRLDKALEAGSIAKLADADFSVKSIAQPYQSFGGKRPEEQGSLYTRVSERLRHKDRGIQLFDYEHLILEAFPQIYKTKCISHSMGLSTYDYRRDLEVAPGFVELVVIPDLTKLIPGNRLEPRAPVSLLEQIAEFLKHRISAFARLKVLNPRYEKINVNIKVQLVRGKSKNYYSQQLKEDLTRFLAPWYLGDSEKVVFGQTLRFSEVVGFVESLDYIDNIQDISLEGPCGQSGAEIKPMTARSILTGGEICVTVTDEDCTPCGSLTNRFFSTVGNVNQFRDCEKKPVLFFVKKQIPPQ